MAVRTFSFKYEVRVGIFYEVTILLQDEGEMEVEDANLVRIPQDDSVSFEQWLEETSGINLKALVEQCREVIRADKEQNK